MEPTLKIGPKHQVTIPAEIFKELQLEIGDFLAAKVKESEIVLRPKKLISKDQEWFWSKEWQKKEREADKDIKAGRLSGPFTSTEELLKHFKGLKRKKRK